MRNISQQQLIDNSNSTWSVEKTKTWQYKKLAKGKAKAPRLTERAVLKYNGWRDGKNGYPRADRDGQWSSLKVQQEIDAYEEYCSRAWGTLQIDMERMHQEVEFQIRNIIRMEQSLMQLQDNLPEEDKDYYSVRMSGEEDLSDEQIKNRRKRELEKKNAPYHSRINELKAAIQNAYEELNEITGYIVEASNAIRLICERAMNHTKQRIDIYWNSAVRHNRNKENIPVSVEVFLPSVSEKTYTEQHRHVFEKARNMITMYQDNNSGNTAEIAGGNRKRGDLLE